MAQKELIEDGTLVLQQGMQEDHAYKVESGTLDIFARTTDGSELLLAQVGPGDVIGEMAVVLGSKRCANARANGQVILTRIPGHELRRDIQKSETARGKMMRLIANRVVRNIPLFADLSPREKMKLPAGEGPFLYPKKSCLFQEGEPITHLYILCSGHVQHFNTTAGNEEITVELHKAGDVFCKSAACLTDGVYRTGARAIDDVYAVKLPVDAFKSVLRKHDKVAERLMTSLAERNMLKQLEMEQRATMTAPEILSSFLRRICASYGLDPQGFTLPYKKSLIAARLGMETGTLSRAWPKLADYGIVTNGARITIVDEDPRTNRHLNYPQI